MVLGELEKVGGFGMKLIEGVISHGLFNNFPHASAQPVCDKDWWQRT